MPVSPPRARSAAALAKPEKRRASDAGSLRSASAVSDADAMPLASSQLHVDAPSSSSSSSAAPSKMIAPRKRAPVVSMATLPLALQAALITVIGFLKRNAVATRSSKNWQSAHSIHAATLIDVQRDSELAPLLQAHANVLYNPTSDSYAFQPDFKINTKEELHRFVLDAARPVDISDLKEICAPDVVAKLVEYSEERMIFLAYGRTGHPQFLFPNVCWPDDADFEMPQNFKDEFFKLRVPDDIDLSRQLAQAGIVSGQTVDPVRLRNSRKEKAKTKDRKRRIKITNVHLAGTEMDVGRFLLGASTLNDPKAPSSTDVKSKPNADSSGLPPRRKQFRRSR